MKDILLKVAVWRAISITMTSIIVYAATGDIKRSLWTTLALQTLLVSCHFAFEMGWKKLYEERRSS
jgi:hypothetical protein